MVWKYVTAAKRSSKTNTQDFTIIILFIEKLGWPMNVCT